MAAIVYRSLSDYLTTLGGLVNIAYSDMPATQQAAVLQYFNNNADNGWIDCNWLPICPNGEARFVGNQGFYPNDLSKTSYWTATNVTVTANSIANPADGRVTASRLLETVTNGEHKVVQSLSYIPGTAYQVNCYARPIGGRYLYLYANDGVNTYYSFFDVATGAVGTYSNNLSSAPSISQASNGFWNCSISFTSDTGAGTGSFGPYISSDGSTISYAGDTAKGLYVWGNVIAQTTYAAPTAMLLPYDQLGESEIDTVYDVWQTSPVAPGYPLSQGYELMPDGIQIIATNQNWSWNGWFYSLPAWFSVGNPLYIYYKKRKPQYSGTAYDALATYAVDDQILFTDSDSVMNFYKCVVATSAGESPDTAPTKWEVLELPDFLFMYVVYASAADYYRMNSQVERGTNFFDELASQELERQKDKQERQQGVTMPFRVQTHLTSRSTGFGWTN